MRATQISGPALVIIVGVLLFAVVWIVDIRGGTIPGFNGHTGVQAIGGDLIINVADTEWRANIVSLNTTTTGLGNGNYETFAEPQGTPYQVPAGKELLIYEGHFVDDGNQPTTYEIGYGDTAVTNSASAPTNLVLGVSVSLANAGTSPDHSFFQTVPAGKYPVFQFTGGTGTLDGKLSVQAYLFDALP